jgi:hypothetical protein
MPALIVLVSVTIVRGQEPRVDTQGKAGVQGQAQINDPNAPKAGAEAQANSKIRVETRGPVHEAFAQPFEKDPKANKPVPKQPPQPIAEEPPDQRPAGDNVQWIPGYWSWNPEAKDFLWVSGIWRNVPDSRRWVPGHWSGTADGWVYANGHWAAQGEQDLQIVPQPPASRETYQIGNAPDNSSFYIPGSWFYTDSGWNWRDGYWAESRPGYDWIPASYSWTPQGYAFTNGYWDYAPLNRGMLFAPVSFTDPSIFSSGFMYRPTYALGTPGLLDSLFVNSGMGQYFFGNYFGQQYSGLGFTPWLNYGATAYDPLYNYLRFTAPANQTLGGLTLAALQSNLQARLNGQLAAPPLTLAEALRLNAAANARTPVLVAPLGDVVRLSSNRIALQPVTAEQRALIRAHTQAMINRSIEMGRANSSFRGGVNAQGRLQVPGNLAPNAGIRIQGEGREHEHLVPNPGGVLPPHGHGEGHPMPPIRPNIPEGHGKPKDK